MVPQVYFIGILNVTPDSFSDGSAFAAPVHAIEHAIRLIEEGADVVDIGADSTRPGSICVGITEEWNRLSPLISKVAAKTRVSIDTHHSEVARRALLEGATIINDVSGGSDPKMFDIVKAAGGTLILMHSTCGVAHLFEKRAQDGAITDTVSRSLESLLTKAKDNGYPIAKLMLDTGMGAFVSDKAEDSFALLRNYDHFARFGLPLVLGCSRKGFLRSPDEISARDRDPASAISSIAAIQNIQGKAPLYIRCHNVKLHKSLTETWLGTGVS